MRTSLAALLLSLASRSLAQPPIPPAGVRPPYVNPLNLGLSPFLFGYSCIAARRLARMVCILTVNKPDPSPSSASRRSTTHSSSRKI